MIDVTNVDSGSVPLPFGKQTVKCSGGDCKSVQILAIVNHCGWSFEFVTQIVVPFCSVDNITLQCNSKVEGITSYEEIDVVIDSFKRWERIK